MNHNIDQEEVTVPIQNHPKREQENVEKDITHIGVVNEVSYNRGIFQRPFCCASYVQIGQILNM